MPAPRLSAGPGRAGATPAGHARLRRVARPGLRPRFGAQAAPGLPIRQRRFLALKAGGHSYDEICALTCSASALRAGHRSPVLHVDTRELL